MILIRLVTSVNTSDLNTVYIFSALVVGNHFDQHELRSITLLIKCITFTDKLRFKTLIKNISAKKC